MLTEPTLTKLNAMKLSTMAESWQEQQKDPRIADLSFDERLGLLVDAEYFSREDRDGDRSTLVASQLPPEKWHEQIGDPTVADAILDRLIHRAYKLNLKGPSRRKEKSKRK